MNEQKNSHALLYRVLDRITRPPVLVIFAVLHAVALAVVAARHLITLRGVLSPTGDLHTGDFMAFYTGATLVRRGQGSRLYDLALQRRTQDRLIGRQLPYWLPYINPPALAAVISGLAGLSYVHAFYLFCVAMLLCLAGSMLVLKPALPRLCSPRDESKKGWMPWLVTLLVVGSFQPAFRTMVGGQNTLLGLLLLAGIVAALGRGRHLISGACLGLLSFKPQYTPLIGLVLLVRGQLTAVLTACLVLALHYLLGGLLCGWGWPLDLYNANMQVKTLEWAQSLHAHFSLLPFFLYLLPRPWAYIAAALFIALTLATVLYAAARYQRDQPAPPLLWGLVITGAVLVSPHLNYYEAAILVLPVLLALEHSARRAPRPPVCVRAMLALGYAGYPLHQLAGAAGFQPLTLWPALIFFWLGRQMLREKDAWQ